MRFLIALVIGLLLGIFGRQAEAGCRTLYLQKIVQPAYVYPQTLYAVGEDIRAKAFAAQVAKEAAPLIAQQVIQQMQALQSGQPGTLSVKAPPLLSQKCARCHSGDNAEGGFSVTGPVSAEHVYRFNEIFGKKRNIPEKMKALVAGIPDAQIGAMMDEMMDLPTADPPAPLAPVQDIPAARTEPDGGLQ